MNAGAQSQPSPGHNSSGFRGSDVDPAAIREQLDRILASVPFRNSKRYPALLQYVVERALDGAASELKERTIGIDVFGREPTYDLGADPVVRISAGEVRKRLAQYYQETAQTGELRIELPLGSYHPEFAAPVLPVSPPAIVFPESRVKARETPKTRRRLIAAGLAVLVPVAGLLVLRAVNQPTALDLFWRPVITPGSAVTLCVGGGVVMGGDASGSPHAVTRPGSVIAWPDAETLARLAGLIQAKGAALRLVREDHASFADFQQNPSVLIGAYNDQWTLELMQKMRFTFQSNGTLHWIADRDRPAFKDWKIDLAQRDSHGNFDLTEDYAIISRVANPRTGFITVTVAGLAGYGTISAGSFLTEPKYLWGLSKVAPAAWKDRDMQIVIGTEVIRGSPGPPKVLATAFW